MSKQYCEEGKNIINSSNFTIQNYLPPNLKKLEIDNFKNFNYILLKKLNKLEYLKIRKYNIYIPISVKKLWIINTNKSLCLNINKLVNLKILKTNSCHNVHISSIKIDKITLYLNYYNFKEILQNVKCLKIIYKNMFDNLDEISKDMREKYKHYNVIFKEIKK